MKPANVLKVKIGKEGKATVIVPEDQLSIAIGKQGQNVRLAGKLTDLELDVESDKIKAIEGKEEDGKATSEADVAAVTPTPKLKKKSELEDSLLAAIEQHGTDEKAVEATAEEADKKAEAVSEKDKDENPPTEEPGE